MQPDDPPLPAAFFMDACAHWAALQVVQDAPGETGRGGSAAPLTLLGGAALDMIFKAVLAASGWSTEAMAPLGRDLEATWGAALDCGLIPTRADEIGDLVETLGSALRASPGTAHVGRNAAAMASAVPIIGSLIVDVGEQFESIGQSLR